MTYFDELKRSMTWLGQQSDTYFIGQAVGYEGTAMYGTLSDVSKERRLELPVIEESQMGMSIGLALEGFVPISIFPRWNFLLVGMSSLINHLDKYSIISEYVPKVIIRTSVGACHQLHPQAQHVGDFTDAVRSMLKTVNVVRLDETDQIFPAYKNAYESNFSTILVEWGDYYYEK